MKTIGAGLILAGTLAGCATVPGGQPAPGDPLEGLNRSVYQFNDVVDRAILRPVARGYRAVVPSPVRTCVHNMYTNLRDIWGAANSFLQNRAPDGINGLGRVMLNTTMGGLGCFDLATGQGVPRKHNDFGITLGVWGIGEGPYLVLPIWGPSTVRDGVGLVAAAEASVIAHIDNVRLRNTLIGLDAIDARANALDATDLLDDIALDPYSFVRDGYLQRRRAMVEGRLDTDSPDYVLPDYGDDPK